MLLERDLFDKKKIVTWKLRSSPRSSNAFYLLSSQCTQCSSPHCSSEVLGNVSMKIPRQRNKKESKTNRCRQTQRLDGTLEEGERWPWPRWTSSHWTGTSPAGEESLDQDGELISKPYDLIVESADGHCSCAASSSVCSCRSWPRLLCTGSCQSRRAAASHRSLMYRS